jgi:hypothetical protein
MKDQLNVNIDIKATTPIVSEDGNHVFTEGFLLRKISKFLTGTPEDGIIPISCFVDLKTGKILVELLPKELREEYTKLNEESK